MVLKAVVISKIRTTLRRVSILPFTNSKSEREARMWKISCYAKLSVLAEYRQQNPSQTPHPGISVKHTVLVVAFRDTLPQDGCVP